MLNCIVFTSYAHKFILTTNAFIRSKFFVLRQEKTPLITELEFICQNNAFFSVVDLTPILTLMYYITSIELFRPHAPQLLIFPRCAGLQCPPPPLRNSPGSSMSCFSSRFPPPSASEPMRAHLVIPPPPRPPWSHYAPPVKPCHCKHVVSWARYLD